MGVWVPLTQRLLKRVAKRWPEWMSFVRSHRHWEPLETLENYKKRNEKPRKALKMHGQEPWRGA